jgi:hypothetical protein
MRGLAVQLAARTKWLITCGGPLHCENDRKHDDKENTETQKGRGERETIILKSSGIQRPVIC